MSISVFLASAWPVRPTISSLVRAVLDRDVLALDETCFLQALPERSHAVVRHISERSTAEKPHHRHRWLLRLCSERPCSRAA
jgi:hypothetical protein